MPANNSNNMNLEDHDLLITLNTKVDGLISTVADMRNGTHRQLGDHELRITKIENDHLSVGGVKKASEDLDAVKLWIHDFKKTWKVIIALASAVGGAVGFLIQILSFYFGWLK